MAFDAARWVASPTRTAPGRRDRLQSGRRVDEVARDHALADRAERDGGLAGQHAGPCLDPGPERGNDIDEVEAGADGALGVVLVGDRSSPHGHDGVADELLDGASVAPDDLGRQLEVAVQGLADVLGVALLGEGGEPDEVGEQDTDETALGDGVRGGGRLWPLERDYGVPAVPGVNAAAPS